MDAIKLKIENDTNKLYRKMMVPVTKWLTLEEKKYLLSVERGDIGNVRRIIQMAHCFQSLDINCVDNLGRNAIMLSIDAENLEMLEILVIMGVETKDALLYAINVEFVEAVEFLLEHEELIHTGGDKYSWEKVDMHQSQFMPDITPLILASHKNNYEILKILLDRGATLPTPHDIKCGCNECIQKSKEDSLRHSLARVNIYKALASPSLIALSSTDPILTAFHLSREMRNLAKAEPEYKSEYVQLRKQCQQFAVDLLAQSRTSQELSIILNQDTEDAFIDNEEEPMHLARLELALKFKQKEFVAHPHIQQLLVAIWYEGVPGFRRKSTIKKILIILLVGLLFPFYSIAYLIYPHAKLRKLMRKPFVKFLIHASSYVFFLGILIFVSQTTKESKRAASPNIMEYIVILYIIGFIRAETPEICKAGFVAYIKNLWNFIDFSRNLLFGIVYILRVIAYVVALTNNDEKWLDAKKEHWEPFEMQFICEGLFATASIFSALKLIHLFSINPHLGPLQISLGYMINDIVKFFFIYTLVVFAFSSGLYQLLGYFSTLECYRCIDPQVSANCYGAEDNFYVNETIRKFGMQNLDSCRKWRGFSNLFEASQSLFWASFGMINIDDFQLTGIKAYTRFWGLLIFGSYSVINITVLLTLLIAMMSNSYAAIHEQSDTEWKFARAKLWMSYFEGGTTVPPPFNIIPIPRILCRWLCRLRRKNSKNNSKSENKDVKEKDYRYTTVMRALVWRYVSAMHRKCEENIITEDNLNEVKGEITSFRYELLDILSKNGMDTSGFEKKDKTVLGKKMKVWERRLMKDFKVVPVTIDPDAMLYEPPSDNETTKDRFKRIAKLALLNSNLNKWRSTIKNTKTFSQIGQSINRDSFKKKQNLKKAIEVARGLVNRSDSGSNIDAINLPDTTGAKILDILQENDESEEETTPTLMPKVIFLNRANLAKSCNIVSPAPNETITDETGIRKKYVFEKEYRIKLPPTSNKD